MSSEGLTGDALVEEDLLRNFPTFLLSELREFPLLGRVAALVSLSFRCSWRGLGNLCGVLGADRLGEGVDCGGTTSRSPFVDFGTSLVAVAEAATEVSLAEVPLLSLPPPPRGFLVVLVVRGFDLGGFFFT